MEALLLPTKVNTRLLEVHLVVLCVDLLVIWVVLLPMVLLRDLMEAHSMLE